MSRPVDKQFPVTLDYGAPGDYSAGFHTGRDYGCPIGTHVHATRDGRVVELNTWGDPYGLHVVVESVGPAGNTVRHGYCHLSRIDVGRGVHVNRGARIGLSGKTGNVISAGGGDGAHLHYEERRSPFLYDDIVRRPQFDLLK